MKQLFLKGHKVFHYILYYLKLLVTLDPKYEFISKIKT